MPVFRIYLNCKKMTTAGVGADGVLGAHVSWVRHSQEVVKKHGLPAEELNLHVGGLVSAANEHLRWLDHKLEVGDEVKIKVMADAPVDPPLSRTRADPAKDLRRRKQYVKDMAKKLGWKIVIPKRG